MVDTGASFSVSSGSATSIRSSSATSEVVLSGNASVMPACSAMAAAGFDHREQHLPPRRSDRAQQSELARALRDGDRERVEDDERADEQRDPAERQERGLDDVDELLEALEPEAVLLV